MFLTEAMHRVHRSLNKLLPLLFLLSFLAIALMLPQLAWGSEALATGAAILLFSHDVGFLSKKKDPAGPGLPTSLPV